MADKRSKIRNKKLTASGQSNIQRLANRRGRGLSRRSSKNED